MLDDVLSIAIVDDDPIVREIFNGLMEGMGRVTAFASGEAFLEAVAELKPNVVLLDITLGEAAIDCASIPADGGAITLVGQDTLVLATDRDPNGCFTMTIAGAPRTVCEAATQRPAPSPWLSILR